MKTWNSCTLDFIVGCAFFHRAFRKLHIHESWRTDEFRQWSRGTFLTEVTKSPPEIFFFRNFYPPSPHSKNAWIQYCFRVAQKQVINYFLKTPPIQLFFWWRCKLGHKIRKDTKTSCPDLVLSNNFTFHILTGAKRRREC